MGKQIILTTEVDENNNYSFDIKSVNMSTTSEEDIYLQSTIVNIKDYISFLFSAEGEDLHNVLSYIKEVMLERVTH